MIIEKYAVKDVVKERYKGMTPIKNINITAEYDVSHNNPKKWIINFKYLEDRRPNVGYPCQIDDIYEAGQIIVEQRVTLKRALKIAFSSKYWSNCHPVLLVQPDNPYFFISGDYICSKHGWMSGILPYIDSYFVLDRHDIVAEASDYAKRMGVSLPTYEDIKYLYNLLDYYGLTDEYEEQTREKYDDTVKWITKCASFPKRIGYLEKM